MAGIGIMAKEINIRQMLKDVEYKIKNLKGIGIPVPTDLIHQLIDLKRILKQQKTIKP